MENTNLKIYNKVRTVPQNAQRKISGGRLDGKTDINPMWRIKSLTENFGMCGIGWKYEIVKKWLETSEQTGEIAAFVDILLYVRNDSEWSDPIPGTGGSTFVAKEKNGPHMSDECFKMALTDAISVACKALGVGADVYWEADKTKYDVRPTDAVSTQSTPAQNAVVRSAPRKSNYDQISELIKGRENIITPAMVAKMVCELFGSQIKVNKLSAEQFATLCNQIKHEIALAEDLPF